MLSSLTRAKKGEREREREEQKEEFNKSIYILKESISAVRE